MQCRCGEAESACQSAFNTGRERPETLDFVDACARAFGVDIAWVEYLWDTPHRTRIVDHATASRSGEPYAALIDRKGFVPNPTLRTCTNFLKRDRIQAYARHRLGLKRWHALIGLRADEPAASTSCGPETAAAAPAPAPCFLSPTPASASQTCSPGGRRSPSTSGSVPGRATATCAS